MLHHAWVETFRTRRSLRAIPAHAAGAAAAAPQQAAQQQPQQQAAKQQQQQQGQQPPAGLQRVEALLRADGVLHSSASSPCLGAQPAILAHLAAAAGAPGAGAGAGVGLAGGRALAQPPLAQLSRLAGAPAAATQQQQQDAAAPMEL